MRHARPDAHVVVDRAPRPTTDSSPIAVRSRTWAWSPTTQRAADVGARDDRPRRRRPSSPAPITASPARSLAPPRSSAAPSATGFPTTAAVLERARRRRAGAGVHHDVRADLGVVGQLDAGADKQPRRAVRGQELSAATCGLSASERWSRSSTRTTRSPDSPPERGSEPSRTQSRKWPHSIRSGSSFEHARRVDVAGARDVLAVGRVVLVEALVVDVELPLELHVVEGRHPARPDHREAALLVRVEPGQVHVRREAGREAQEREDDVLHARLHVALADRAAAGRAPRPRAAAPPTRRARPATRARSRPGAAFRG